MYWLRRYGILLGALMCALLDASPASAQTLRGEVYDSLIARGPMEGARVMLDGLPQSAMTDRRGRFVLADVPVGSYLLTFFHPTLDSARLSAPAYRVTVPPEGLRNLQLATPSFATTSRFLCGTTLDSASTIVLGRVRAAEDGRALAGATARVSWWEMNFGGAGGTRQVDRTMTVDADSLGEFRLCGVPTDVDLTMTVRVGAHQSGQLAFPEKGRAITIRDVVVSLSDSAATAAADSAYTADPGVSRRGSARLRVRVLDERARPIENATVGIRGHAASGTSNARGDARLVGVPAGSQTVVVRAVGRAPLTQVVALKPGEELLLDARLTAVGVLLPEYRVTGLSEDAFKVAYDIRRRSGSGTFLDNDDLNKIGRRAQDLTAIGGVRAPMSQGDLGYTNRPMIYFRGVGGDLCVPTVFVDGVPRLRMDGWELHILLQVAKRLEIYRRGVSIPSEFANGGSGCGVLVIWTTAF
jgi:hypothetical protein